MMIKERREAYVEVLEILRHMDKKYIVKIPRDLIEFFESKGMLHKINGVDSKENILNEISNIIDRGNL